MYGYSEILMCKPLLIYIVGLCHKAVIILNMSFFAFQNLSLHSIVLCSLCKTIPKIKHIHIVILMN